MFSLPFTPPSRIAWRATRLFLTVAAAAALALGVYYMAERTRMLEALEHDEALSTRLGKESLLARFQGLATDLKVLAGIPELAHYLDHPTPENRKALAEDLRVFSNAKRIYDQVRLLDARGMEIIRVNWTPQGAAQVPPGELQPKGDRYYFRNAAALPSGSLSISPLDLNMEQDRIETPHKPMLRLSTPLHGPDGSLRGVLVLNYLAANALSQLDSAQFVGSGRLLLVNREGYWIKGLTADDEWGFMLPGRRDRTFGARWPATWAGMAENPFGRVRTGEGLFTYASVRPFSPAENADQDGADPAHWTLVSWVSPEVLQESVQQLNRAMLLAGGLLLAVLAPGSAILAWTIARRKATEQALRARDRLYRTLAENFPNGAVMLLQPDLKCILAEGKGLTQMGLNRENLEGRRLPDLLPAETAGSIEGEVARALTGEEVTFEVCFNGECYQSYIVPVYHEQGPLMAEMFMVQNITARKKLENALQEAATRDPLTGLHNRRRFNEQLDILMGLATRYASPLCLCLCDIDHFKQVNDTYGHAAGDAALVGFGNTARGLLRQTDLVARLGGDEFAVLFPQTALGEAVEVVERLRVRLQDAAIDAGAGGKFSVTSSLGVAQFAPGMTAETFLEAADNALYAAKRQGRNRVGA